MFSTASLHQVLYEQVYDDASGAPMPGHPQQNGSGCSSTLSRFQVHKLSVADGKLREALITFELPCNPGALIGCVHVTP